MRRLELPLAVVVCALVSLAAYNAGYHRAETAGYQQRTDTIRIAIARLDTVYRRDTLIFWRTKRLVDTLVRVDSIPVIARDSSRADSALRVTTAAVQACSVALLTCEARVAREQQLRREAEAALAVRPAPSPRLPVLAAVGGALAGALTALLLQHR